MAWPGFGHVIRVTIPVYHRCRRNHTVHDRQRLGVGNGLEFGMLSTGAWNVDGYWGSSGGISTSYAIPDWQTNIVMRRNGGSTTFGMFPMWR